MRGFDRPRKRRSYRQELAARRQVLEEVLAPARRRLGGAEFREIWLGIRHLGRTRDPRRIHLRNAGKDAVQIARDVFRGVARRGQLTRQEFLEAVRAEIAARTLG